MSQKEIAWTATAVINALTSLQHFHSLNITSSFSYFLDIGRIQGLENLAFTVQFDGASSEERILSNFLPTMAQALTGSSLASLQVIESFASPSSSQRSILEDLARCLPTSSQLRLPGRLSFTRCCVSLTSVPESLWHSLQYLTLTSCVIPTHGLWAEMSAKSVHLRGLDFDDPFDDELLDYLESYTGLEELSLMFYVSHDQSDLHTYLSERFYWRALPMHAISILKLKIYPEGLASSWCIDDIPSTVLTCRALSELTVPISDSILDEEQDLVCQLRLS